MAGAPKTSLPNEIAVMSVPSVEALRVKIFADGARRETILDFLKNPAIKGFTTNPTLMKQAGIADYEGFCRELLTHLGGKPISYEVFSDDFDDMERQALKIATWGDNVFVKIPVSNTRGDSAMPLVRRLTERGVKLNVTAIMTLKQVDDTVRALQGTPGAYVSVFAGRVADTGRDSGPLVRHAVALTNYAGNMEVIYASTREVRNIFEADEMGVHIITVPADILGKLKGVGRDLDLLSLDAVKAFYKDGQDAGFTL
jgi:transaldolase